MFFKPVDPSGKSARVVIYDELTNKVIASNDLYQTIDGKPMYIADGQTLTSESVFSTYSKWFGNSKNALRLKTVHYHNTDEYDVEMSKHDEKSFPLNPNTYAEIVGADGLPIVVIKRINNEVNIYEPGKEFVGQEIHYLQTDDESKIRTGPYKEDNVVHEMPSESVGVIAYTQDRIKSTGMLSTQMSYFISDPVFQRAIMNHYLNDNSSRMSPRNLIKELLEFSKSPEKINELVLRFESQYMDALPSNVPEAARLGAGFHPMSLMFLREVVKNKYLKNIADFRTDGTYLDFRADLQGWVTRDETIMPYNEVDSKQILEKMGKKRGDYGTFKEMVGSINEWLKSHDHHVIIGRSPLVAESGWGLYKVKEMRTDIGDTFILHPIEVKERHKGDHDYDHGHVARLVKEFYDIIKPHIKEAESFNLHEFERLDTSSLSMKYMVDLMNIAENMVFGETAIGEIVNTTRIAAIMHQMFGDEGHFILDGRKVKVRSLQDIVTHNDMTYKDGGVFEGTLADMLGKHTQAALDHPVLLLLNKWDYSVDGLRKRLFYYPESPMDEIQDTDYKTIKVALIKPFLSINNKVDNMVDAEKGALKFNDIFELSSKYHMFMKDRENIVKNSYGVHLEIVGKLPAWKQEKYWNDHSLMGDIVIPAGSDPVALQEAVTSMFSRILDQTGKGLDNFYNIPDDVHKQLHFFAIKDMYEEIQDGTAEFITNVDSTDPVKDLEIANSFAQKMAMNFYSLINRKENIGTLKEPNFIDIVTPKGLEHNDDFIQFHAKWSKHFNELANDFQQRASTLTFLYSTVIENPTTGQYQGRKNLKILPTLSTSMDTAILHPEIIREYFTRYNKAYKKRLSDSKFKDQLVKTNPPNGIRILKKRFCE